MSYPQIGQSRTSTSSVSVNEISTTPSRRTVSKELISKSSAMPVPISLLSQDKTHSKFFQAAPLPDDSTSSPAKSLGPSPVERVSNSSFTLGDNDSPSSLPGDDGQLSSSLPTSSNLDVVTTLAPITQRSNSELGHYPDLHGQQHGMLASPEQSRPRERMRSSYHPTLGTVLPSPLERPVTPENASPATMSPSTRLEGSRQVKISAPLGGQPIPHGYKFGSKDETNHSSNDRERKAKSRTFWGFGRTGKNFVTFISNLY